MATLCIIESGCSTDQHTRGARLWFVHCSAPALRPCAFVCGRHLREQTSATSKRIGGSRAVLHERVEAGCPNGVGRFYSQSSRLVSNVICTSVSYPDDASTMGSSVKCSCLLRPRRTRKQMGCLRPCPSRTGRRGGLARQSAGRRPQAPSGVVAAVAGAGITAPDRLRGNVRPDGARSTSVRGPEIASRARSLVRIAAGPYRAPEVPG
jgi:hypothetical protein